MENIVKLCNYYSSFVKLSYDISFKIKETNPQLFEALSHSNFIAKELCKIHDVNVKPKEFSYLINEIIKILPVLLTYAKNSFTVDKRMFLDYKNIRTQLDMILEKYMKFSEPSIGFEKENLDEINFMVSELCEDFVEFIDKISISAEYA